MLRLGWEKLINAEIFFLNQKIKKLGLGDWSTHRPWGEKPHFA